MNANELFYLTLCVLLLLTNLGAGLALGRVQRQLDELRAAQNVAAWVRSLPQRQHGDDQAQQGEQRGDHPLRVLPAELDCTHPDFRGPWAVVIPAAYADDVIRAFEVRRDLAPPPPVSQPGEHARQPAAPPRLSATLSSQL